MNLEQAQRLCRQVHAHREVNQQVARTSIHRLPHLWLSGCP